MEMCVFKELDVNNYGQGLNQGELASARLVGWSVRWSLSGSFVLCCQCLKAQAIGDSSGPFQHVTSCPASELGNYPWHELKEILSIATDTAPAQMGLIS